MHSCFAQIRIFDLDYIIQEGCKNSTSLYRQGKDTIPIGGLLYLTQLIAEMWNHECTLIIVCRNLESYSDNETAEYSLKDPLTRLQYEIVYERIESIGIKLIKCDSDQELEEQILILGTMAQKEFAVTKIYSNRDIMKILLPKTNAVSITGEKFYKNINFEDISNLPVKNNNYLFTYCANKLGDKAELLIKEFNEVSTGDRYEDSAAIGPFIIQAIKDDKLTQEEALKLLTEYNKYNQITLTDHEINWNIYDPEYNSNGLKIWCQMLKFTTIIEYLGQSLDWAVPKMVRSWLTDKFNAYLDGTLSVKNNLSTQTSYFVEVNSDIEKELDNLSINQYI